MKDGRTLNVNLYQNITTKKIHFNHSTFYHIWNSLFILKDIHILFLLFLCQAPSYKYEGHGSHVTNVRFTYNDSHLLSMGGKDTCILQWRVKRAGTGDDKDLLPSSSVCPSSVYTDNGIQTHSMIREWKGITIFREIKQQ